MKCFNSVYNSKISIVFEKFNKRLSLKGGTGNRGTGNIGEYRGIFKRGNIGESLKGGISGNL